MRVWLFFKYFLFLVEKQLEVLLVKVLELLL
jgi:hypothetical protein